MDGKSKKMLRQQTELLLHDDVDDDEESTGSSRGIPRIFSASADDLSEGSVMWQCSFLPEDGWSPARERYLFDF